MPRVKCDADMQLAGERDGLERRRRSNASARWHAGGRKVQDEMQATEKRLDEQVGAGSDAGFPKRQERHAMLKRTTRDQGWMWWRSDTDEGAGNRK